MDLETDFGIKHKNWIGND